MIRVKRIQEDDLKEPSWIIFRSGKIHNPIALFTETEMREILARYLEESEQDFNNELEAQKN